MDFEMLKKMREQLNDFEPVYPIYCWHCGKLYVVRFPGLKVEEVPPELVMDDD